MEYTNLGRSEYLGSDRLWHARLIFTDPFTTRGEAEEVMAREQETR